MSSEMNVQLSAELVLLVLEQELEHLMEYCHSEALLQQMPRQEKSIVNSFL